MIENYTISENILSLLEKDNYLEGEGEHDVISNKAS